MALVLGSCWQQTVLAQVSVSLYPSSFRLNLKPGEIWEGILTAVNPNKFPLVIKVEKENFGVGDEGSINLLGVEKEEYGLSSWISYNQKEFEMPPDTRREVPFQIRVPLRAQPGGHYAAVLFRASLTEKMQEEQGGLGVSGRVGAIILAEVAGNLKKEGSIEELTGPKFISHGPLAVSFKINNSGNSHFNPEGKATFLGWLQKKEAIIEPKTIFGGYSRSFDVRWDKRYLFGPITVTVSGQIPNGPELTAKSITVWAFPWQEISVLAIMFILLVFGWKQIKRRFRIIRIK